jgi:uncharacterized membrane protein YqiK
MQVTHDNDCEHRIGHDCTCGASNYLYDLAAARAEIERLKRECDGLRHIAKGNRLAAEAKAQLRKGAEAERDKAVAEALREIRAAIQDGNLSQGIRLDIIDKIALRALSGGDHG